MHAWIIRPSGAATGPKATDDARSDNHMESFNHLIRLSTMTYAQMYQSCGLNMLFYGVQDDGQCSQPPEDHNGSAGSPPQPHLTGLLQDEQAVKCSVQTATPLTSAAAAPARRQLGNKSCKKAAAAIPATPTVASAGMQPALLSSGRTLKRSEPASVQRRRSGRLAQTLQDSQEEAAQPDMTNADADAATHGSQADIAASPTLAIAQQQGGWQSGGQTGVMVSGVLVDIKDCTVRDQLKNKLGKAGLARGLAAYYRCGAGNVDGRRRVAFKSLLTGAEMCRYEDVIEAERADQGRSKVSFIRCLNTDAL